MPLGGWVVGLFVGLLIEIGHPYLYVHTWISQTFVLAIMMPCVGCQLVL
jgi:1,4-dihydroxy-2-naphthoate octaprenyltransferase